MERCNWLVRRFSEDPFGDALIKAGLTEKILRAWSADPQLFPPSAAPDEKVKASLFGASLGLSKAAASIRRLTLGVRASDLLEDLDAEECLEKCAVRQQSSHLRFYPRLSRLIGLVWAGNRAPESNGDRQQEMKRPTCFIRRSSRASP